MIHPNSLKELEKQNFEVIKFLEKKFIPYIKQKIQKHGGILEFVCLYGSRAKGNFAWNSDIDLFICSNVFKNIKFLDRIDLIKSYPLIGEMEILCYTKQEVQSGLEDFNLTILEICEDGLVLFENSNFFKRIRGKFTYMKNQGLIEKGENSWVINTSSI
jgi:predicted nucleotidyltransferase